MPPWFRILAWIRRQTSPPVFEDEEQNRIAGLLTLISLILLAVSLLTATRQVRRNPAGEVRSRQTVMARMTDSRPRAARRRVGNPPSFPLLRSHTCCSSTSTRPSPVPRVNRGG